MSSTSMDVGGVNSTSVELSPRLIAFILKCSPQQDDSVTLLILRIL